MNRLLLDTNVVIALINDKPQNIRARFQKECELGSQFFLSTIVEFELRYGVAKSQQPGKNEQKLKLFLRGTVSSLPFEAEDAAQADEIRAMLEKRGIPISAYDVQIAGQARRHDLTLVTANVGEFSRVPELRVVDWTLV